MMLSVEFGFCHHYDHTSRERERERERERFYLVIVYKIKELMNATCYTCCGLPMPFSNSGDLVAVLYVISSTPSIGVE